MFNICSLPHVCASVSSTATYSPVQPKPLKSGQQTITCASCLGGFTLHYPPVLTALTKTSCVASEQQRVTTRGQPLNVSAEGFRVMLS